MSLYLRHLSFSDFITLTQCSDLTTSFMESYDQLDPVHFYLDESLSSVDWPPLQMPPDLDIPPDLDEEPMWDPQEWNMRGLASNYPDDNFTPTLHAANIERLWTETEVLFPLLPIPQQAMKYLLSVASNGYSSQLTTIQPSVHYNVSLESRLWKPAVVVIDQWIRKGFLHGPYDSPPFSPSKINGLLLIPKGESNVRVCTDMSRPVGQSFNSCVHPSFKQTLPLKIADFSSIKRALSLAGSGCYFLKHDLVDAYKKLAIHPDQLPAQQFKLGSCYFYDSCLIFGDITAVHGFSFLHNGIIHGLVQPYSSLPPELSCLCIDDLVVFSPASQLQKLWDFDARYRFVMDEIGFQLQDWDDNKLKSFGPTTEGLVLGVYINTKYCSYNFPPRKLSLMLQFVETCYLAPALTLNQMQKLAGKITYLCQIDSCFATATGFLLHQLQAYLKLHPHWQDLPISRQPMDIVLTPASRHDLLLLRSLFKLLQSRHFPMESYPWQPHTRIVYTDASGALSQGVGALLLSTPTKAFSIPLPDSLLLSGLGHVQFIPMAWRTACLELMPVWSALLMFAADLRHSQVLFYIDNQEAVLALTKKTSSDYCTCLLVRLIMFTASILDISIQAIHVNRRSDVYSSIADDLTHFDTSHLFRVDPFAFYTYVPDLPPVTLWYNMFASPDPAPLFRAVMDYISTYPPVKHLLPRQALQQHA